MNIELAYQFADKWVTAWNNHDLEQILSHYEDDFRMYSPVIAEMLDKPDGFLEGKLVVEKYWEKALSLYPELEFKIESVYSGSNSVAIVYDGVKGKVTEVFKFGSSGKVYEASAHYAL